ncbi:biopolymer transporter ExbD [Flavobacterium sp. NRK1]|uniref:ExbD/TolR family protein n=1 Tax=Flavobacterium sp. NRK1 TaxID=2954929 RepID=UPI002091EBAD|nr:biopolymer transporter ExbD [Flavobacterium sp. NRK1]MCO6147056.1 biopolymer transporter ExbD [Flavobacterium sp. NRK1]
MAKVKISKKSTRIDMTAMCDVAFLLLSFFIMTATAKQPEPKPVDTPASTVLDKLPEEGVATITVGDKQAFLSIPDPEVRRGTLERISTKYGVNFTDEEYKEFSKIDGFGVKINELKGLLKLDAAKRNEPGVQKGIPFDTITNQLGDWVQFAREAQKAKLDEKFAKGEITVDQFRDGDLNIAIKGDAKEDYPTIKRVMDILQEQKKNRFYLVTGLRDENF